MPIPFSKNKPSRKSPRANWWNYGNLTAYFITTNVKDRKHNFGTIRDGQMILSHVGVIADLCWQQTIQTSPDWECIEYVIMPDHFHALVRKVNRSQDAETPTEQTTTNLETGRHNRYRNPGKNTLSSVVGKYKSMVTRHARRLGYEHAWQGRYHDSIVRDKDGILRVQHYIKQNVSSWSRA